MLTNRLLYDRELETKAAAPPADFETSLAPVEAARVGAT
jgi:hypothetical protein